MELEDLILVSVDDHAVEPPDLFENHVPSKWSGLVPNVVRREDGSDAWMFQGKAAPNFGLNAVAGRPPEEYGMNPMSFDDMRDGCYDIHARVRDMNANGVLGSMCFPSFPGFGGRMFHAAEDKDASLIALRAYNDWHLDEWCGTYEGRFIPLAIGPLWNRRAMVEEVHRVAAQGCHAFTFPENPAGTGLPGIHSEWWNPFWEACSDEGTIVCMHIGSSGSIPVTSPDSPVDVTLALMPINIVQAAVDLAWCDALRRYPDLKFCLSEGGIGWVPYVMERVDRTYQQQRHWTGQDFGDLRPSDVFREHVVTCFVDDPVGIRLRHDVGIETITWETDFPHSDSTWPYAPEHVLKTMESVPNNEIDMITHANALRHFRYDPFSCRSRKDCTVGALRHEADGVDTSPRSSGRPHPLPRASRAHPRHRHDGPLVDRPGTRRPVHERPLRPAELGVPPQL